jgi:hypothetical protein
VCGKYELSDLFLSFVSILVCRFDDLYLATSVGGSGPKERRKLNLTVKRELQGLGGKIIAQSGMAKGPDGTSGFVPGWTSRQSPFIVIPEDSIELDTAEQNTAIGNVCETVESLCIDSEPTNES